MARIPAFATRIPKLRVPRLPDLDTSTPDEFEEMTLQEHLEELRDRIIKAIMAIVPAFIVGAVLAKRVLLFIVEHAHTDNAKLDIRAPTDPLTLYFKVALYIAIAIAAPVIVYQAIAFLAPGMTKKEKRYVLSSLPFVTLLFVLGVLYAWYVAAPRALAFLSGFMNSIFSSTPDGPEVLNFFLTLMIGLGLSFQVPVIMFIFAKLGIVGPEKMRKWRKYAFMLLLVLSAVITPSTDPINMGVVALPLVILYEIGIVISSLFAKTTVLGGSSDAPRGEDSAHIETKAIEKADDV